MIRQPRNWNEVQEFSERAKLPLDAYVCKVKQAAVQTNECIVLMVAGSVPMALANPVYKWVLKRYKKRYGEEILQLSEELLNEKE